MTWRFACSRVAPDMALQRTALVGMLLLEVAGGTGRAELPPGQGSKREGERTSGWRVQL